MKFLDLQMFAEAVQGKKLVYLYRVHSKGEEEEGTTLAFTTENSRSVSKDADSTATKDGSIRTPGEAEIEISCTSILTKGDTKIDEFEQAMLDDELFDIWEANLEEPANSEYDEEDSNSKDKFKGMYYQGYLTSLEKTSSADGFTEISLTFGINGNGVSGNVTVSAEDQEAAIYAFEDTTVRSNDNA